MGYSQSISIGPYLEVPKEKDIQKVRVKRICPDHPGKKMKDEKFCPMCGKLIENVDEHYTEKVSPMSLLYDFEGYEDDDLYSPEFLDHLIIPNQYPPSNLKGDISDGGDVDLTDVSEHVKKDLEWFKEKYGKYITFLESQFGELNVKLRWGIVSYWS